MRNMEGEYDPKKRFEEYLKEKEGQPIDSRAVEAGKRELKLGEKGDFAVYGDEPDKEKLIASYPQGRMSEDEEIKKDTRTAREKPELDIEDIISRLFNMEPMVEKLHPEKKMTEKELKKAISELTKAKEQLTSFMNGEEIERKVARDKIALGAAKIGYKYNIRANLSEFPGKIEELIKKYRDQLKGP